MRPTTDQMKAIHITPASFDKLVRFGLVDGQGRSKQWYDHQRPDHDRQFEEVRERKQGKKKFSKNKPEAQR